VSGIIVLSMCCYGNERRTPWAPLTPRTGRRRPVRDACAILRARRSALWGKQRLWSRGILSPTRGFDWEPNPPDAVSANAHLSGRGLNLCSSVTSVDQSEYSLWPERCLRRFTGIEIPTAHACQIRRDLGATEVAPTVDPTVDPTVVPTDRWILITEITETPRHPEQLGLKPPAKKSQVRR